MEYINRKKELIIIAAMLIISFVVIIAMKLSQGGDRVVVSYNGNEYGNYNLNHNQEIEISTDDGTNILKIENGEARMIEASCPDKICMNMAPISAESRGVIVCLPNKIIVEVKEE